LKPDTGTFASWQVPPILQMYLEATDVSNWIRGLYTYHYL